MHLSWQGFNKNFGSQSVLMKKKKYIYKDEHFFPQCHSLCLKYLTFPSVAIKS